MDIAHGTRMKLISVEKLCRGVTACGRLAREAVQSPSERPQDAAVRLICQIPLATQRAAARPSSLKWVVFMRFLKWFRSKPAVTLQAQIVVYPAKPQRTDLPEFCVEEFEGLVNLWPFASDVLAEYGKPVPFSADVLARLAVRRYNGKYIKVDDYPPGIDRDLAKQLISRTIKRARWISEFSRKMRSIEAFPSCELHIGKVCCARARKLSQSPVATKALVRVPLDGCWEPDCQCSWRLISTFDRKRKGK